MSSIGSLSNVLFCEKPEVTEDIFEVLWGFLGSRSNDCVSRPECVSPQKLSFDISITSKVSIKIEFLLEHHILEELSVACMHSVLPPVWNLCMEPA